MSIELKKMKEFQKVVLIESKKMKKSQKVISMRSKKVKESQKMMSMRSKNVKELFAKSFKVRESCTFISLLLF